MIPTNPITLGINGWLIDKQLEALTIKYLPAWDLTITSGYRSPAKQKELLEKGYKPDEDSAHLYNLARDFNLINKISGKLATDSELKKIYEEFIKPNWEGYSYFSPKQSYTNTGWVHVNLPKSVSDTTKFVGWAGTGIGLILGAKLIYSKFKK